MFSTKRHILQVALSPIAPIYNAPCLNIARKLAIVAVKVAFYRLFFLNRRGRHRGQMYYLVSWMDLAETPVWVESWAENTGQSAAGVCKEIDSLNYKASSESIFLFIIIFLAFFFYWG